MLKFAIALAQINPVVGDIAGNAARVRKAIDGASQQGAELVVFSELVITGYPPEDLILKPAFRLAAMEAVESLARSLRHEDPAVLLGCVWEEKDALYNAAILIEQGRIVAMQYKYALPNYGIFDERRLFVPGPLPAPILWRGRKLGLMICEDMWQGDVSAHLAKEKVDCLITINASPFETGKYEQRQAIAREAARNAHAPLIYVNQIGAQDDIVFDGASFALDVKGEVLASLPAFAESVQMVSHNAAALHSPTFAEEQACWQACVLGLKDYVNKNGFSGVLLGLSGGIDSAFVAALAVDALGSDRVLGVLLPSPYNAKESEEDALETARLLDIRTVTVPISANMEALETTLNSTFSALGLQKDGWMEEVGIGGNLQARIRGVLLMALSNASGYMLLSTSNKSELAVGYSTLYGDSCGGYAPLKDLYKTRIYAMAKWRNGVSQVIPQRSITKAPSAELKPGQLDQDQLPPYEILDAILECLIEQRQGLEEVAQAGFSRETVEKIVYLLRISEYKRRQSPPGPKITPMLFGRDRRYPLTNGFKSL